MSELYELPDGWEWAEWKSIVNVKNGKDYKSVLNENGLYPIYGSGGVINYANEYLCNENTVIIGRKGTINSPIFVKEKFWNIDTAFGLEAKKDKLIPLFLYYFTLSFNFLTLNKSTTLPSLAKSNLQKILMPLPSILEQKRIVSKLDNLFKKIDKSIALHQKNMNEADVFMGSVLNDVFGELEEKYGITPISSIMKINNQTIVPNDDETYNYVGLENIESNSGKLVDYAPSVGKDIKSSKVHFKKGMVLYGKLRPYLNKVWIADFDGIATTEILPFYPIDDNLSMQYVKYYFLSPKYLAKVMSNCSGARMPRLTTKFIKSDEAYIPVPSLSVQQKTISYLDEISQKVEKIKSVQKEKMQSLVALKASILDQAFRGEL